ncbi:hypothetical protein D7X30_24915 [Corallococcus sp. AB011P]|nr:hypothetical protein D7X30_24915 [Corallococcus sp. AB011P]RKH82018.1 hypothetical protein D7Y21_29305 [Corallococcus sp. AB045]
MDAPEDAHPGNQEAGHSHPRVYRGRVPLRHEPPGIRGRIRKGGTLTSLYLELYRHDGLRQAVVELSPSLLGK